MTAFKVLALEVDVADPKGLRDFADKLKDRLQSGVIILGSSKGDKAMLIAVVTKDLTDRLHAGKIVGQLAAKLGGRAAAGLTWPRPVVRKKKNYLRFCRKLMTL